MATRGRGCKPSGCATDTADASGASREVEGASAQEEEADEHPCTYRTCLLEPIVALNHTTVGLMGLVDMLHECVEDDVVEDDRGYKRTAVQADENCEVLSAKRDMEDTHRTMKTVDIGSKAGLMQREPFVMTARYLATQTSREY